jgi:hypothetical protein
VRALLIAGTGRAPVLRLAVTRKTHLAPAAGLAGARDRHALLLVAGLVRRARGDADFGGHTRSGPAHLTA